MSTVLTSVICVEVFAFTGHIVQKSTPMYLPYVAYLDTELTNIVPSKWGQRAHNADTMETQTMCSSPEHRLRRTPSVKFSNFLKPLGD